MIPSSSLTPEQEYATLGSKIKPEVSEIEQGTAPLETLPSQWMNYYLNKLTLINAKCKSDIDALTTEFANVLSSVGVTPNAEIHNQLASALITKNTAQSFAAVAKTNPYTAGLTPRWIGDTAVNTTTKELWKANVTAGATSSWELLWTADNDGTGSGLDAGLFCGIDVGSFIKGATGAGTNYVSTIGDITMSGFYTILGSSGECPYTGVNWTVIHTQFGAGYSNQIAMPNSSTDIWIRVRVNYSWSYWRRIWNEDNDGSGSGLDADLLDGHHSSLTGGLQAQQAHELSGYGDATVYDLIPFQGACGPAIRIRNDTSTVDRYLEIGYWDNAGAYHGLLKVRPDGVQLTRVGSTIWDAGNDGAGSGLDADLIRGTLPPLCLNNNWYTGTGNYVDTAGLVSLLAAEGAFSYLSAELKCCWYYGGSAVLTGLGMHPDFSLAGCRIKTTFVYEGEYAIEIIGCAGNDNSPQTALEYTHHPDGTARWTRSWNNNSDGVGSGLDAGLLCGVDPRVGTAGTHAVRQINNGTNWVIPAGTYMMTSELGHLILEIFSGTIWGGGAPVTGLVMSDGTNYRVGNYSGYDRYLAYRKLY